MEKSPTILTVVAGLLGDDEGRVLLQKRPPGKEHGGLWEFPGGKVEAHEAPRPALVRELNEELGITVETSAVEPLGFAESTASAPARPVVILLYTIRSWRGAPTACDGAEIAWIPLSEAHRLPMPPLDIELLERLGGERGDAFG